MVNKYYQKHKRKALKRSMQKNIKVFQKKKKGKKRPETDTKIFLKKKKKEKLSI